MIVEATIEISKGSNIKYEYDHKTNKLICDRVLHTPITYFFNYGFIENTISEDGDEVDIIVLCEEKIMPTSYVKCKVIGVLKTIDEEGNDPKIIAVPSDKVDPDSKRINNLTDISQEKLDKIVFFYDNYKKLEKDKWVKIIGLGDREEACEIIKKSVVRAKL